MSSFWRGWEPYDSVVEGVARIVSLFLVRRAPYILKVGSRTSKMPCPFEALRARISSMLFVVRLKIDEVYEMMAIGRSIDIQSG